MKKIKPQSDTLLVLCAATFGGPTSSAINLLYLFSKENKAFDVFLMDHEGNRTADMAKWGNLLPRIPLLADSITDKKNLKTPMQYLRRVLFVVSRKLFGTERARGLLYKRAARYLNRKYKNVIAYQESVTSDFVRYIDAPNRISWMHTDYDKLCSLSPRMASREVYDLYHHITSVTRASADRMKGALGRDSDTVHVIQNPLIPEVIIERANEPVPCSEQRKKPFLMVSVGRLSGEKAFHRIPEIAKQIKDYGIKFDWYIIGDGATRKQIEDAIDVTGTADVVHLLGSKSNPYPYMRMADVLVITSEYEAQPMVANEALILGKPVISTEFASIREVINDGVNGIIASQSIEEICGVLVRVINDDELRFKLTKTAEKFEYDNDYIVRAVDSLLI